MKNIQNIYIVFVVFTVLQHCVRADESNFEEDGLQLRFGRRSKQPENTSESVKKQKTQQKQEDSVAVTRSQLTPTLTNSLTSLQTNVNPTRNLYLDNQLNAGILPRYALNFPFQGYPPQQMPSIVNTAVHPLDQINHNFLTQQPQQMPNFLGPQQSVANSYAPGFMGGYGGPSVVVQQEHMHAQQNLNPAYGNNLWGLNGFPINQPGLQNNLGLIPGEPVIPPVGYPSNFNQPGQLNGMSFGSLPGVPSPLYPNLPPPSYQPSQFNYPLEAQQPQLLNHLPGNIPLAMPPQNGFNNGIGNLFAEFIRNQRSLEQSDAEK